MWQRQDLALRALARIRPADLVQWREERLKQVGPKTVRNELLLLRHVFEMATKEFGIEGLGNPVARISLPSPGKARDRRLEMGEGERLMAVAEEDENIWIASLIGLAVETGARRGELANLTWDDVNLNRRTAVLRDTKNGDDRVIPLGSKAIRILEGLPRNIDGRVFPLEPDSITQAFTRVRAAAGLPDLHFHDLRHEAISRFFELGLNPMEVASISGHKTMQMLRRYTHLRAEDLARKLG
jgi:integrase